MRKTPIFLLTLVSGATALIYEVLWLDELSLLFGSTAQAAATTLAVFFLGLALGSWAGGARAARSRNPLRLYAWLELGIALSALLYFGLTGLFRLVYAPLLGLVGDARPVTLAIKLLLATVVLLPPACFMGATLPVLGQHLVRRREMLGLTGSALYAVNVLGAATGALLAGFFLPRWLGYDRSYLVAVALNAMIAVVAWWLSRSPAAALPPQPAEPPEQTAQRPARLATAGPDLPRPAIPAPLLWTVALSSGLLTLGLEVLWTRLFSLVLHKSVYTFAAILLVFLVALAVGSALAHALCRVPLDPAFVLWAVLLISGVAAATSCHLFLWWMNGLAGVPVGRGWGGYVRGILASTAVTMLVPVVVMGAVFPYLLRTAEGHRRSPGELIGRLAAWNTVGAILGSLIAGFLLVSWVGVWASIHVMALAYVALALVVATVAVPRRLVAWGVSAAGLAIVVASATYPAYPLVRLLHGEELMRVWQGAHGTVAVVETEDNRRITLNNHYSIGGSAASEAERRQAHLPLLLHPDPQRVFFLGLGTGITAGAALDLDPKQVVVAELVPEIVTAAHEYFDPYVNGLFEDRRVRVVVEDGRNWLMAHPEPYDVIVADLFTPWNPGTGTLYSREHFKIARSRLARGGLFAQWIPLHQVSEHEFGIITRTMAEVFPSVTLWRGDFFALGPNAMLLGRLDDAPLDAEGARRRARRLAEDVGLEDWEKIGSPFVFYTGNVSESRALFDRFPVNTDDRPVVEYDAPVTYHRQKAKQLDWLVAEELIELYDAMFDATPPETDPYLARLGGLEKGYVRAGLALYRYSVHRRRGNQQAAQRSMDEFQRLLTAGM